MTAKKATQPKQTRPAAPAPAPTPAAEPPHPARITTGHVTVFTVTWVVNPPGTDSHAGHQQVVYFCHDSGAVHGAEEAILEMARQRAAGVRFSQCSPFNLADAFSH